MQNIKLMSHLIAGFPDEKTSIEIAHALVKGGASFLEIQLPFSDPSADGPAIQTASTIALEKGFSTKNGLKIVAEIHKAHPNTPIYIMTYGSLAFTPGVKNFVKMCKDAGANGCIIPDLPFDNDEGLTGACKSYGLENIPVAAPSMTTERLTQMTAKGFNYIYAALRAGTTGSKTTIDQTTLDFIDAVGKNGAKVLGGFGIQSGEQSKILCKHVYAVVAGSVFVNIMLNEKDKAIAINKIEAKANELTKGA